jgi:hypothetical protein
MQAQIDGGPFAAAIVLQVGVKSFVAAIEFWGEGNGQHPQIKTAEPKLGL